MSNESKRAAFVLPDEKSEYVISQKHFVFRFKDDGDLKAIVCDQSDAHKFTAIDELYEALELEEDRDRLRVLQNRPFDAAFAMVEEDEAEAIHRKWRGRYPLVFSACKPHQDAWAVVAKHLRDKALAKARGEATP